MKAKKVKYKRMTTWFTPSHLREMKQRAKATRTSQSSLVRDAWDCFIANHPLPTKK